MGNPSGKEDETRGAEARLGKERHEVSGARSTPLTTAPGGRERLPSPVTPLFKGSFHCAHNCRVSKIDKPTSAKCHVLCPNALQLLENKAQVKNIEGEDPGNRHRAPNAETLQSKILEPGGKQASPPAPYGLGTSGGLTRAG